MRCRHLYMYVIFTRTETIPISCWYVILCVFVVNYIMLCIKPKTKPAINFGNYVLASNMRVRVRSTLLNK